MAGSRARRPQSSFLAPTTPRFSQRLRERGTGNRAPHGAVLRRTNAPENPAPPARCWGSGPGPGGATYRLCPARPHSLPPPARSHPWGSAPPPVSPRPAPPTPGRRHSAHCACAQHSGSFHLPPPGCPQPCRTAWPYCGPCRPSGAALGGPRSPREGLRGRAAAPGLRIGAGRGVEVPAAGGGRGAAARLGSGPRGDPCRSAGRAEGCGSPRRAGRAVPSASGTALRERAGPGGTGGIGSQSCERPADGSGGAASDRETAMGGHGGPGWDPVAAGVGLGSGGCQGGSRPAQALPFGARGAARPPALELSMCERLVVGPNDPRGLFQP